MLLKNNYNYENNYTLTYRGFPFPSHRGGSTTATHHNPLINPTLKTTIVTQLPTNWLLAVSLNSHIHAFNITTPLSIQLSNEESPTVIKLYKSISSSQPHASKSIGSD